MGINVMSMLSKSIAIVAAPVGLMLSAASAHASFLGAKQLTPSSETIAFNLCKLGGLGATFSASMALAALVVVVANLGLLWWQERRDGRKRGPN